MDNIKQHNHNKQSKNNPELLSPGKNRYGRTRKSKIENDFYNLEQVEIDEKSRENLDNDQNQLPSVIDLEIKEESDEEEKKNTVQENLITKEWDEEYLKFDNLGVRCANNFKMNRHLNSGGVKERRFFKSVVPENTIAEPVDVTKVLKLISSKPDGIPNLFESKSPKSTTLKTYCNKRKYWNNDSGGVVESFGLPDEPIIPIVCHSPIKSLTDKIIDIDLDIKTDVNLPEPLININSNNFERIDFDTKPEIKEEKSFDILELCKMNNNSSIENGGTVDRIITSKLSSMRSKMDKALGIEKSPKKNQDQSVLPKETKRIPENIISIKSPKIVQLKKGRPRKSQLNEDVNHHRDFKSDIRRLTRNQIITENLKGIVQIDKIEVVKEFVSTIPKQLKGKSRRSSIEIVSENSVQCRGKLRKSNIIDLVTENSKENTLQNHIERRSSLRNSNSNLDTENILRNSEEMAKEKGFQPNLQDRLRNRNTINLTTAIERNGGLSKVNALQNHVVYKEKSNLIELETKILLRNKEGEPQNQVRGRGRPRKNVIELTTENKSFEKKSQDHEGEKNRGTNLMESVKKEEISTNIEELLISPILKRPKGRPRKNNIELVVENKLESNVKEKLRKENESLRHNQGRGRPPNRNIKKQTLEIENGLKNTEVTPPKENRPQTIIVLGRGRPRRNNVVDLTDDLLESSRNNIVKTPSKQNDSLSSEEDYDNESSYIETPTKRSKGRLPKSLQNSFNDESISSQILSLSSESEFDNSGKKRKNSSSPKRRSARLHPSSILLDINDSKEEENSILTEIKIENDAVTIDSAMEDKQPKVEEEKIGITTKTDDKEKKNVKKGTGGEKRVELTRKAKGKDIEKGNKEIGMEEISGKINIESSNEENNESSSIESVKEHGILKEFNELPMEIKNRLSHFKRRSGRLHASSILLDIREDKFEISHKLLEKWSQKKNKTIVNNNKVVKKRKTNLEVRVVLNPLAIKAALEMESSQTVNLLKTKSMANHQLKETTTSNKRKSKDELEIIELRETRNSIKLQNNKLRESNENTSNDQLPNNKKIEKTVPKGQLQNNQIKVTITPIEKDKLQNNQLKKSEEYKSGVHLKIDKSKEVTLPKENKSKHQLHSNKFTRKLQNDNKSKYITRHNNNIKKHLKEIKQKIVKKQVMKSKKLSEGRKQLRQILGDCKDLDEYLKKLQMNDFYIGDLAWAKIGSYPYWPCLIMEDPTLKFHKKCKPSSNAIFYHVRFFADKGRRAWVRNRSLMLYHDGGDLERITRAAKLIIKTQGKLVNPIIMKSCMIKSYQYSKWKVGVDEAESLRPKTVPDRLKYFDQLLKELALQKEEKTVNDAVKKIEATEEPAQDIKKDISPVESPNSSPSLSIKKRTRLSLDSEALSKRLKLTKKNGSSPISTITAIVDNKKKDKMTSQENKETTDIKNRRLLTNQVECSNSDTDSKFSDNSSVPTSLESQAALYKKNNIFRGISKDKVCQICQKSGDIFRCKGPCCGFYHYKCAITIKPLTQSSCDDDANEINNGECQVEIVSVIPKNSINLPQLSIKKTNAKMSLEEKIDLQMMELMQKVDYNSIYIDDEANSDDEFIVERFGDALDSKLCKKNAPLIKHVTADSVNYIYVTDDNAIDEEVIKNKGVKSSELSVDKKLLPDFRCDNCVANQLPPCLICKKEESKNNNTIRLKCSFYQCGKFYHAECLKVWPQTQWSIINNTKQSTEQSFVCPRHVCHTCISDDPRAATSRCYSTGRIVKCLDCPATYHTDNCCVPAGSIILSSSQIICPRHFDRKKNQKFNQTVNANWCFICSKGGDLICCETCPTSVHTECLPGEEGKYLQTVETFFCEDCQSGRLPLYDEIVWVKLGSFRWWPAVILFPNEIPDNVKKLPHGDGEFAVKFFGTYNHYWVGRGRTFLFQEGDKGQSNSIKNRVDNAFLKAVEEAAVAHTLKKKFKITKAAEKNTILKPPPYIRIKVNKPVGNVRLFDGNTSNTTSCDCDPNQPHPCGPDTDCLNRLLLTECNPDVCPAGERCNNQCFEKREYPPLVPHHTQSRGWGLKTLAPVRKGQFVIEYVGEMIDEQEYQRRVQKMHEQKEENYYFLTIDNQRMLDAGPKGNVARFMNHSCQPNCETQKWTVNGDTRVGLFATCDIPAGTELTFNYNLECIGKERKICKCGAPNCSGFIGVKVKTADSAKQAKKKSIKINKKVNIQKEPEPAKDNPCFMCGKLGNVGACNNKICTKFYHLECLGMTSWPEGAKWVCPWHNCNFCSKRTIRCCVKCINSYCPPHSEGNVRYDKLLGFVCSDHDPTKELTIAPQEPLGESPMEISTDDSVVSSTPTSLTMKPMTTEDNPNENKDENLEKFQQLTNAVTSTPLKTDVVNVSINSNSEHLAVDLNKDVKNNSKNQKKTSNISNRNKNSQQSEIKQKRITRSSLAASLDETPLNKRILL